MRVQRKEIKKPNSERVRYAITEMNEAEFSALIEGLRFVHNDKTASRLLKQFTEIADEY